MNVFKAAHITTKQVVTENQDQAVDYRTTFGAVVSEIHNDRDLKSVFVDGSYWNGKVYGKSEKYVYIENKACVLHGGFDLLVFTTVSQVMEAKKAAIKAAKEEKRKQKEAFISFINGQIEAKLYNDKIVVLKNGKELVRAIPSKQEGLDALLSKGFVQA